MWFQKTKSNPDADKALGDARQTLEKVRSREGEVLAISEASKEFRRRNHFAHDLQILFERGGLAR